MNPHLEFIKEIQANVESAKKMVASGAVDPVQSDQKVLLFSPHPDDECITGLLPLRLMREAGMQVINVPVTFGSDPGRQAARVEELKNACAYPGFQCLEPTSSEFSASRRMVDNFFQPLEKSFQPLEPTALELAVFFQTLESPPPCKLKRTQ